MARKIIACDCETDPFKYGRVPVPFLWGAYDGETYCQFDATSDFARWAGRQDAIIYAHNGGKFDFHFLSEFMEPFSEMLVIDGRITAFRLGSAEFRDSFAILPTPLRDFCKTDIDYRKLERHRRGRYAVEIAEYLKSDCVNLWNYIAEFQKTYGRDKTLASAAMSYWRRNFPPPIPAKTSASFYDTFKDYYFGGRVEAFKKGIFNGKFYTADINSAYPKAMLSKHPYGDAAEIRDFRKHEKIKLENFYTVSALANGAFALRNNGTLIFPADGREYQFKTTGHELCAAIETGATIIKIHNVVSFVEQISFGEYVNHFYSLKNQAKRGTADYIFAKLFLNSLYGKFGMNGANHREHILVPSDLIDGAGIEGYEFAGTFGKWAVVSKQREPEEWRFYNVATAASITGYVRATLWRAISAIRKSGGDVFYCDTDSIIFEGKTSILTFGDGIGEWKNEGTFDALSIAGKKLYAARYSPPLRKSNGEIVTHKIASKGVKVTATEIEEICRGRKVTYRRDAPTFSIYSPPKFLDRELQMT